MRHASSEVGEDIVDGDAHPTDDRLTAPLPWLKRDNVLIRSIHPQLSSLRMAPAHAQGTKSSDTVPVLGVTDEARTRDLQSHNLAGGEIRENSDFVLAACRKLLQMCGSFGLVLSRAYARNAGCSELIFQ